MVWVPGVPNGLVAYAPLEDLKQSGARCRWPELRAGARCWLSAGRQGLLAALRL